MTVVDMLAKGNLIVPFDRSVPAVHSFYVVCRNEMRSTPIVKVFIDWIYAALAENDARAEPQVSGRSSLRRRAERPDRRRRAQIHCPDRGPRPPRSASVRRCSDRRAPGKNASRRPDKRVQSQP